MSLFWNYLPWPNLQGSTKAQPRKAGLNQVYPIPAGTKEINAGTVEYEFQYYIFLNSIANSTSIVAMHGLDAQSPKTWIAYADPEDSKSQGIHWLQDSNMLPAIIPNSRIFTYDWNASVDKAASSDIFLGHADTLLDRLRIMRHNTVMLFSRYVTGNDGSSILLRKLSVAL